MQNEDIPNEESWFDDEVRYLLLQAQEELDAVLVSGFFKWIESSDAREKKYADFLYNINRAILLSNAKRSISEIKEQIRNYKKGIYVLAEEFKNENLEIRKKSIITKAKSRDTFNKQENLSFEDVISKEQGS